MLIKNSFYAIIFMTLLTLTHCGSKTPFTTEKTFDSTARLTTASMSKDKRYYADYQLELKAGSVITAVAYSADFNPSITLYYDEALINTSPGYIEQFNDKQKWLSRLIITAEKEGIYTLRVTSEDEKVTGKFTLSTSSGSALEGGRIINQTYSLSKTDSEQDGYYYKTIEVIGRAGETAQIHVTASDFNPHVKFYYKDTLLAEESEGSVKLQTTYHNGPHKIIVSSMEKGATGHFTLEYSPTYYVY